MDLDKKAENQATEQNTTVTETNTNQTVNNTNTDSTNTTTTTTNKTDEAKPQEIIFTQEQKDYIKSKIAEYKTEKEIKTIEDKTETNGNNTNEDLNKIKALETELATIKAENTKMKKGMQINSVLNGYSFTSNYVKSSIEKDLYNQNLEKDEDIKKYIDDLQTKEPSLFKTFNQGTKINQSDKTLSKDFEKMSLEERTALFNSNPDKYYQLSKR